MHRVFTRLIAILLLLAGAADYVSFDTADPFASMSDAGLTVHMHHRHSGTAHRRKPARLASIPLPDDCCLCCGNGMPAKSVDLYFQPVVSEISAGDVLPELAPPSESPHLPPKFLRS